MFFLDESGFALPASHLCLGEEGGGGAGAAVLGEVGAGERGGAPGEASPGGWVLGYRLLEGRCGTGEVVASLWRGWSREVAREGVRGVVFLDNAPFHRSRAFREAAGRWRERGLEVAYLPPVQPAPEPGGGVWRRVKGLLMPRRHYGSVEELRGAVAEALERLRERIG